MFVDCWSTTMGRTLEYVCMSVSMYLCMYEYVYMNMYVSMYVCMSQGRAVCYWARPLVADSGTAFRYKG